MDKNQLEAFAREAAKSIKTESDLNDFRHMLAKVTVETALNAELDDHLGYDRYGKSPSDNSRNGYSSKTLGTLKTDSSKLMLCGIGMAALSRS